MVVAFNTKLVNPAEIKSYWDLLNPKWKEDRRLRSDPGRLRRFDAVFITTKIWVVSSSSGFKRDRYCDQQRYAPNGGLAGRRKVCDFDIWPGIANGFDSMQTQGLPVDWFKPDHLKEGTYITGGSGGLALINKAPHPNAAKVGLNWLLSREGQIAYQRLFAQGNDGPDSMRIDIPKDKVPRGNRRPEWTTAGPRSSIAPSGWIRSRSLSLLKKCWSNGENRNGNGEKTHEGPPPARQRNSYSGTEQ